MSPQSLLKPLMEGNFLDYASYVIMDRAIPDLRDGCKPVQRRILHTLFEMHDGKFHKVANVIGEAMKLHPHGDASIGDALVVLANKDYFIEKQGNFGNIMTGHPAAAARYIECRLTPLAMETLFNPALTETIPSYDGRRKEPKELPAKVPVLLMLGAEGIAVGMATTILPHNFPELLRALVSILKGEKPALFPDFPQGGLIDVSEYSDGAGRVKVRARIEKVSGVQKLVISEVPYSTTTTSLIASIEAAVQKGKVSVSKISDFTSDHVEIELALSRGAERGQGDRSALRQHGLRGRRSPPTWSSSGMSDPSRSPSRSTSRSSHAFSRSRSRRSWSTSGAARRSAPLADPGADLHREPRLQAPGESRHGRGGRRGRSTPA